MSQELSDRHWQVSKWCGVFAGIGGGAVVMGVLQQYGFACMGQSLTLRLRALLLSSMLRQARCSHTLSQPMDICINN